LLDLTLRIPQVRAEAYKYVTDGHGRNYTA
jgi:hypothetical protein